MGSAKNKVGAKVSAEASKIEVEPRGGCFKALLLSCLMVATLYMAIHVYFIWQPAGKPDALTQQVMEANIRGLRIFPAVQAYPLEHIAGRVEIMGGRSVPAPLLKQRLQLAYERNYPVTFREEEINAWLAKRLEVRQVGKLAPFVKVRGVWVDFKQDELELIIERELPKGRVHVSSLFMNFSETSKGSSISRHSCQIGQTRLPGGFARLLMPAFSNLMMELDEDMQLYHDGKIHDVRVEDGKVTIDPRRPGQRL